MRQPENKAWRRSLTLVAWSTALVIPSLLHLDGAIARGQDEAGPTADVVSEAEATEALEQAEPQESSTDDQQQTQLNLFRLILKGRWLMIPIGLMSIMVIAFGIERGIGLRRFRVMPEELVRQLGGLGNAPGGFDPRKAYRICQAFPSSAATVIRAMLLKIGRPHVEVEHAVNEASEREAERLYANVRWLNLAATVTPLMGLLGTVWGMIQAFFNTTQLVAGQNKADFLAEGIYVALVTTLGGLSVAIPAAILAHFFEGRIQTMFHQIDEMLFGMMPQIERFEGRLRVSHQQYAETGPEGTNKPIDPPVQNPKPAGVPPASATSSK